MILHGLLVQVIKNVNSSLMASISNYLPRIHLLAIPRVLLWTSLAFMMADPGLAWKLGHSPLLTHVPKH